MSADTANCARCRGTGLVDRWVPTTTTGGGHVVRQVCLCSFPWGRAALEDDLLERGELGRLRDVVAGGQG